MNIRTTMTAVALGTMTLAGCSTMNDPTPVYNQPVVSTPAAAPSAPNAVTQTAASNLTAAEALVDDMGVITSPTRMVNESAMMDPYTRAADPSVTGLTPSEAAINDNMVFRNPGQMPSGNDSSLMDPYTTATTRMPTGLTPAEAMINDNMVMREPGQMPSGNDSSLMDPATTAAGNTASAATPLGGNTAVMDACFAAGGQVVSWVGDPTGAEQACRREDGLEYRLADAQYYQ